MVGASQGGNGDGFHFPAVNLHSRRKVKFTVFRRYT